MGLTEGGCNAPNGDAADGTRQGVSKDYGLKCCFFFAVESLLKAVTLFAFSHT